MVVLRIEVRLVTKRRLKQCIGEFRIIDRARQLEVRYETAEAFELRARLHQDLRLLSVRARLDALNGGQDA